MKKFWLWFFILAFLALIQTTLFPFPFFFPLFLALTVYSHPKESFWLAFGSGVFLDLFAGTALGRSSLALLLIAGLVNAYKRRYFTTHPAYTLSLSFVGFLVFNFLVGRPFSLVNAALVSLLAWPAGFLISYFAEEKGGLKIANI